MVRIDGKKIAGEILVNLKRLGAPKKKLVLISFEPSESFGSFAAQQLKVARELGVGMSILFRAETKNTKELLSELERFGGDEDVGGIVIQLPLPKRFVKEVVLVGIPPEKDVDCLNPATTDVLAPAVSVVNKVIALAHPVLGAPERTFFVGRLGIVGAGILIGKPLAKYFSDKFASVQVLGRQTPLDALADADVVIAGTGVPRLIDPARMLKNGSTLIDFGYPGDVDERDGLGKVGYYCPSKGGTGPVLVACMFENFYRLTGLLK